MKSNLVVRPWLFSKIRTTTIGIPKSNTMRTVRHPLCHVMRDRRDMWSHLSMDITAMVRIVMVMKATAALSPIVRIVITSAGVWHITVELIEKIKSVAAYRGWATSPVHKSLNANPLNRIWNGVRKKFLFQIAAKISKFATTATGDKAATMIEVERETCFVLKSSSLEVVRETSLSSQERVVLFVISTRLDHAAILKSKFATRWLNLKGIVKIYFCSVHARIWNLEEKDETIQILSMCWR